MLFYFSLWCGATLASFIIFSKIFSLTPIGVKKNIKLFFLKIREAADQGLKKEKHTKRQSIHIAAPSKKCLKKGLNGFVFNSTFFFSSRQLVLHFLTVVEDMWITFFPLSIT